MPESSIQELIDSALAHHRAGNLTEAEALYREVIRRDPNHSDAQHLLGLIARSQGRLDEALAFIQQAVTSSGGSPMYLNSLGVLLQEMGRFHEATVFFQEAIQKAPQYFEARVNLAEAFRVAGRTLEAISCYVELLGQQPDNTGVLNSLGVILQTLGKLEEAQACFERVLAINPQDPNGHNNLGLIFQAQGRFLEAHEQFQTAYELDPGNVVVYSNLANTLRELGRLDEAISLYQKAIASRPGYADAYNNLGNVLRESGRLEESMGCYRRALEINPHYSDTHRNLLVTLMYLPVLDVNSIYNEHRVFESQQAERLYSAIQAHQNNTDPERKLKIGYLSGDFRVHPVGFNLLPLLTAHDRAKVEIFLYSNVSWPDVMTRRFEQLSDHWRSIYQKSEEEAVRMIRDDGIDILVSLAGRFDNNRPLICAYKPAPVQVSMHDAATSGMKVMDYLISDITMSPRNSAECFTERLVRLPTFYIHAPINDAPPVSSLPAMQKGYVTFGSFNNPAKLTPQVIDLWGRVLNSIPNSRLMLKYRNVFSNESIRNRYQALFADCGIDKDRLHLIASDDTRGAHLARYAELDIVLDPFPFNGSTTTFEALWMGVPVVTLTGSTMLSRWGTSMLRRTDLMECVASNEDDYVAIAMKLSSDLAHLAAIRGQLRESVTKSPLCNATQRARQMERAYRYMWRKNCSTHV